MIFSRRNKLDCILQSSQTVLVTPIGSLGAHGRVPWMVGVDFGGQEKKLMFKDYGSSHNSLKKGLGSPD